VRLKQPYARRGSGGLHFTHRRDRLESEFSRAQGAVAGAAAERRGVFWIGGLSHTPNAEPNPSRGVRVDPHGASIVPGSLVESES